jgi:hypothetical protein
MGAPDALLLLLLLLLVLLLPPPVVAEDPEDFDELPHAVRISPAHSNGVAIRIDFLSTSIP